MLNCLKNLILLGLLAATATAGAQGELVIRITEGVEAGVPIAIVPFGDSGAPAPQNIAEIIANDLRRSGRFAPLPMDNLPALPREAADVRFSDWRLLGTESLVIGKTEVQADGQYTIQFRLFDVVRGGQIAGFRFRAPANGLRRTAHQIADIIYEKLTGEPGAFNTRIAYITEGPSSQGGKLYSLKVADSDGYNPFTVLGSRQPMMSPAWSPDGNKLAYVAFDNRQAHIFVQDLASGTRQEIAAYPGINGAPAWSPDGTRLAMTLSKDGNAEIYVLDLNSRDLRRLTQSGAIDTEAAWAPDGESLVFTSDRGGKPQIYRIPASGGRAQRVTFEGEYNARATYSPDGNRLAMVHNSGGGFRIALLDLQSNGLRELTSSNLDESPSFAPNGSMILYATADSSGATLAAVSTDGSVKQRLAVEGSAVREPAWSPLRK